MLQKKAFRKPQSLYRIFNVVAPDTDCLSPSLSKRDPVTLQESIGNPLYGYDVTSEGSNPLHKREIT